MTVEELSERILSEGDIIHAEEDADNSFADKIFDESDTLTRYGIQHNTDESDALSHYGVLGMKWGIRKDRDSNGTPKRAKKDRRYEDETDQEYQNRMQRESQERVAKIQAKERAQTQKRQLKSQEKIQRMQIQAQKEQRLLDAKNQQKQKKLDADERKRQAELAAKEAKQRRKEAKAEARKAAKEQTDSKPTNARNLSDKELNDAIQRLRNERTYKELSLQNKSLPIKTVAKVATVGGGILLAVGTAVAKKQLTDVGNQKASAYLEKKGLLKQGSSNKQQQSSGITMEDVQNLINEAIKSSKG